MKVGNSYRYDWTDPLKRTELLTISEVVLIIKLVRQILLAAGGRAVKMRSLILFRKLSLCVILRGISCQSKAGVATLDSLHCSHQPPVYSSAV